MKAFQTTEFEKWLNRNWKEYSLTKWRKNFGQRIMGKQDGSFWHGKRIVLIYNFSQKKSEVKDFAGFLKDSQKFFRQYEEDYEIDGAYFVSYGEYDKKTFNYLLRKSNLSHSVKIKNFKTDQSKKEKISKPKKIKEGKRKRVFIVHGREKTPALELARLIEKRFPIETIFLEEKPHRGRTLIEKLEDYSNVDFALITLTPDDVGALKGKPLKKRGRQNVIFEWGQFIGKIGRKNVCLLIKGDIDIPSDLRGIGHHRFYKKIKECFIDVENELREAKILD